MGHRERSLLGGAALVLASAVIVWMATPSGANPAVPTPPDRAWPAAAAGHEAAFLADINSLRVSRGLPVLEVNANLVSKARTWAVTMAAARRIRHSRLPAGITADWRKLGENVGTGGSEQSLHAAFVASSTHYRNLIDPGFRYIGIGVVDTGERIFVSEFFMQLESRTTAIHLARRPPGATPPLRLRSSAPTPRRPPLFRAVL